MLQVGVVGASGYSGVELVRLLMAHPRLQLRLATADSNVGKNLSDLYPQFVGRDIKLEKTALDQLAENCQLVFLCLPHGESASYAAVLHQAGVAVIDLSADLRLKDSLLYQQHYGLAHKCPELLENAVYGLPELHRAKIKTAKLIANPGCYATGALLGLLPLFQSNLKITDVIVDAKSGVSGAGRKADLAYSLMEASESFKAYNVSTHRHQPEIRSQLATIRDVADLRFTFTPHLLPIKRGILSTIYIQLSAEDLSTDFHQLYLDFYAAEPFVKVLPPGILPQTKAVSGTNYCHLNLTLDKKARRLIVITVIDNLLKGAAGQAMQNANLIYGWEETTGLTALAPLT